MNVQKNETTFPFPVLFLLGARALAVGSQVLGALIAKQAIPFSSSGVAQPLQPSPILLRDDFYTSSDVRTNPPSLEHNKTRLEADVTAYKLVLDVVAVSPFSNHESFGKVTRSGGALPSPTIAYGWQPREEDPRKGRAGNAGSFTPDQDDPFNLPTNFNNLFFNGSRAPALLGNPLKTGDSVRFEGELVRPSGTKDLIDLTITIPLAPTLKFTQDCWTIKPPVMLSQGVDTVVLLAGIRHVLLTWRFVFVWEDRLALATLELS